MPKNILFIDSSLGIGGSTTCLKSLTSNLNKADFIPSIAFIFQNKNCAIKNDFGDTKLFFLRSRSTEIYLSVIAFINKNDFFKKIKLDGAAIILAKLILERAFSFIKILRLIKKEKIQIIHLNSGISAPAILAAKIAGIPCISTIRSFCSSNNRLASYFPGAPDKLVSVSEAVKESALRYLKLGPEKIKVIYDGVESIRNADHDISKKNLIRTKYNILPSEKIVGTVGRLVRFKRQDLLIKALKILIEKGMKVKCFIVGAAETNQDSLDYERNLKKMINDLGLSNNVIFTGFKTNPSEIMRSFDVFVLPSITEPFGMVVLEAFLLKIPVIAFDRGGPAEIITNNVDGLLVPTGNIEALAKSICLVLSDGELAEKLSTNAVAKIKNTFAIEKTIEAYSGLYDSMIH